MNSASRTYFALAYFAHTTPVSEDELTALVWLHSQTNEHVELLCDVHVTWVAPKRSITERREGDRTRNRIMSEASDNLDDFMYELNSYHIDREAMKLLCVARRSGTEDFLLDLDRNGECCASLYSWKPLYSQVN